MASWTNDELSAVGNAEELQIASVRSNGSLRPYVTIWVVRSGDALYVRSAYGSTNPWFVRAQASGIGRISAGGVERDVEFAEADPAEASAIDAAYRSKYSRYPAKIVDTVVGPEVAGVTIKLVPRT